MDTTRIEAPNLERSGLEPARLREMLFQILLIREFEDATARQYALGNAGGFVHLCQGQEASAVGAVAALEDRDFLIAHYRDHGYALARGVDANSLMAELFGRVDGVVRGRGGSMHFFSSDHRMLGGWAIVGGHVPVGVGLAFATEYRRRVLGSNDDAVGMAIMGDGATNIGYFWEALNFAALWKVPLVFYIENNMYGMGTALATHSAVTELSAKAALFGMPSVVVDGMDPVAVHGAVAEAVATCRRDRRPYAIEARTYRYRAHSMADPDLYRDKEEIARFRDLDPVTTFPEGLIAAGIVTSDDVAQMLDEAAKIVADAVAFAAASPEPPAEELHRDIVAPIPEAMPPRGETRTMTITEALNAALDEWLAEEPTGFIMGEDVNKYGGAYGVTRGLPETYGDDRVRDTPIAEGGIAGVATGAAMGGLKPVAEIMTVNFALLASDAIINHAAKVRSMFAGQAQAPIVVRTVGGGVQLASTHSQNFDTLFAHIPGLRVCAVATPHDAKGLLATALRLDDPVVVLEHQLLYRLRGEVPVDVFTLPVGRAFIEREGQPGGVTLVGYSRGLQIALEAAQRLADDHGLEAEVINLRWLRPLDTDTVVASVKKTNRVVVVEDDWRSYGVGAEVAARIQEDAFDWLDAPVLRVAAMEVPVPYAANLERQAWPSADRVLAALGRHGII